MNRRGVLPYVVDRLRATGAEVALIGASAMAGHGVARSTGDVDLLCVEEAPLRDGRWSEAGPARVDVRVGEADDPLDGVIRARMGRGRPVDVVFLVRPWARALLERSLALGASVRLSGVTLVVPSISDLILLKLYAGGPRDLEDIRALLAVAPPETAAEVLLKLGELPPFARRSWERLTGAGP